MFDFLWRTSRRLLHGTVPVLRFRTSTSIPTDVFHRSRREIGLLKALGFVKSQVGATVCWQASTVALVGIVVGVPLGVAGGRAVWRAFATNLGAVPVSVVPVEVMAALGAGVLVVANLLALAPAVAAARSKSTGQLLRAL